MPFGPAPKYLDHIEYEAMTSCHLWLGQVDRYGYGRIKSFGKKRPAHRMFWTCLRGTIPDGLHVLHRCDTPLCMNVDHMFLGTNLDNIADKLAKDRGIRGSRHHGAKLSESDIPEIMRLHRTTDMDHAQIGARFGVSPSVVSAVVCGTRWKHVARE